jgi:hypothetical protein
MFYGLFIKLALSVNIALQMEKCMGVKYKNTLILVEIVIKEN